MSHQITDLPGGKGIKIVTPEPLHGSAGQNVLNDNFRAINAALSSGSYSGFSGYSGKSGYSGYSGNDGLVTLPAAPTDAILSVRAHQGVETVNNAGKVSTHRDISGNGNHLTQTDPTKQLTVLNDGAAPGIIIDATNTWLNVPAGVSFDPTNFSIFVFKRVRAQGTPSSGTTQTFLTVNTGGSSFQFGFGLDWGNLNPRAMYAYSNGIEPGTQTDGLRASLGRSVVGIIGTAAGVQFFEGGRRTQILPPLFSQTVSGGSIGADQITSFMYPGFEYSDFRVFNRALSAGEATAIIAEMNSLYGGASSYRINLVYEGHSIMYGEGGTHDRNLPRYTDLPGDYFIANNAATPGSQFATLDARRVAEVDYYLSGSNNVPSGLADVLMILCGVNDVAAHGLAAAQAAAISTIAAYKAAAPNRLVGMMTMGPSSLTTQSDFNAWNAWLLAGSSGADFVINTQAPEFGGVCLWGAQSNAALYADTIHPTNAGYLLMGLGLRYHLTRALANLGGYSGYSGFSGVTGASGASGFSGYSGATGGTGTAGTSGFSGYSGKSGFSGYSGAGTSGFSGYSGAGSSGFSGYSGKSGFSGYSGGGTSGFSGYSGSGAPGTRVITTADVTPVSLGTFNVAAEGTYIFAFEVGLADHTNGGSNWYYRNLAVWSDGFGSINIATDGFNQIGGGSFVQGTPDFTDCDITTSQTSTTVTFYVVGNNNSLVWRVYEGPGERV